MGKPDMLKIDMGFHQNYSDLNGHVWIDPSSQLNRADRAGARFPRIIYKTESGVKAMKAR